MKKHTLKTALLLASMAAIMLGAAAFPPNATAQEPKLLWEKEEPNIKVLFSPDSKYLVVNTIERIVKFFHVETGELYKEFENETAVMFTPDGKYLITQGSDKDQKFTDTTFLRNYPELEIVKIITNFIYGNFSDDSKYIAASMNNSVDIYDFESGALLHTLPKKDLPYEVPLAGGRTITNTQFNPKRNTELLISYSDNYRIDYPPFSRTVNHMAVYDLEEKKIIAQSGIGLDVWNISYLDSSHILRLCSYYDERKFQLINIYTGQIKQELKLNADQFDYRQASIAPFVLTGGGGHGFSLWSSNSLVAPVYTFPFGAPYHSDFYCLSRNADYIAIGDEAIQVYKSPYSSIPGEKAADNLLYPNPSSGIITIPLEDVPNYELKLIIHDMSGKEVYSGIAKIEGNNVIVDVAHYAKGSYLIMLQGNGFSRTYKFVKE